MSDQSIDITQDTCPMTFVRVKLKLEEMSAGQTLEIRLNGGEPLANVPRSLQDEGYQVDEPKKEGDVFLLRVSLPDL